MSDVNTQSHLPADHPAHANLNLFLRLLLALAPAATAPFIKSDGAKAIFAAELPILQSLGTVLDSKGAAGGQ